MSIFTAEAVVEPGSSPIQIDGGNSNAVKVDGSSVTQPVSAISLPLPTNAAQETGGHLASIDSKLTAPLQTISAVSNSSTVTQVVITANTNTQLLAANANRKKAILFLPKNTLYIKLGVTASNTSFTYVVTSANTTIEITGWTGEIDCYGTAQTSNVTELV